MRRKPNACTRLFPQPVKELLGEQRALNDPAFMAQKAAQERKLRAAVAAKPELQRADGSAWNQIAKLQTLRQELAPRYGAVTGFAFSNGLLGNALTLVEAAEERAKPNAQRLPEYTDQALIGLEQELTAPIPVYPDLEETTLGLLLQKPARS